MPGCYYHVYNRGAHKLPIYREQKDYKGFTQILAYYLLHPLGTPKSILDRLSESKGRILANLGEGKAYTLLAYCLMPNHFHLMIRQDSSEITISNLMRRLCTTYAMYFNHKYQHSGTIFQGKYKNVLIENEYQWIYLSKYIHRNPAHLQRTDPCVLADYSYSSYQNYLGKRVERWLDTSEILGRYPREPNKEYRKFVEDGGDVGDIEKLTLDVNVEQDG